jgi:SAM-dependent methyltransferase
VSKIKSDYLDSTRIDQGYYEAQYSNPYRSTIAFLDWLTELGMVSKTERIKVLDVGAGMGETLFHFAQSYPNIEWVGLDINPDLVQIGNQRLEQMGLKNVKLIQGDLYDLDVKLVGEFDGLVCLQTLSWLPDFKDPLKEFSKLRPKWIALSSLFYDGNVAAKTEITVYDSDNYDQAKQEFFYNTYSLPAVENFARGLGYAKFKFTPFNIDIDIERPAHKLMGTYTQQVRNGERLQLSGPILMNWKFVLVAK